MNSEKILQKVIFLAFEVYLTKKKPNNEKNFWNVTKIYIFADGKNSDNGILCSQLMTVKRKSQRCTRLQLR